MAYASASQSGYGGNTTVIHTDAPQADVVSISDAELLFTGHLERRGPDLVLTGHDGHHHIIPGYFSAEHHADLVAPNGARLTGELVDLLAGSPAPGQYAQAQATVATDSIGRIEKVVGDVTVMRNGVAVSLHVGDAVYKNDVIQTGSDSSCGIGFPDGTALNLVANTRMALNDYVYDPNGTSNDALFNLVQGGFAFVAGKVAHTGDMKIGTPVATMGIRGTTGYALEQVAAINANAGNVTMSFAVVADPGSDRVGQYDLIDQFGNVVAQVGRTGIWTNVQFQGPNLSPTVTTQPMTAANYSIEQALVPALVQILNNINNLNPNPQSGPNNPGSSTPPLFELINFQQNFQQNGAQQQTVNVQLGGSNGQNALSATFAIASGTPGTTATSTVIWTSPVSGTWETGSNWNDSIPPSAPEYVNINEPVKVTVVGTESAYGLRIASGAILNIASGATLEVSQGIADFGTLQINSSGSDPTLAINGTVYLLNGGRLALVGPTDQNLIVGVAGTNATLVNVNNTIIGSGTIGQSDGALTLVNGKNGTIEAKPLGATDSGLLVIDTGQRVSNSGLMAAASGGTLQVADNVTNFGLIQASVGGTILLAAIIANSGTIGASGSDATVGLEAAHISSGALETDTGGVIETLAGTSSFSNVTIAGGSFVDAGADTVLRLKGTTSLDGTVTFEGPGTFKLEGAHVEITGKALRPVELDNDGTISGAGNIGGGDQHFVLVNERSGTIDASGLRALVIDNDSPEGASKQPGNAVINAGTIEATGAGGLTIENTTIVDATDPAHDTGLIEAAAGSQVLLENATIIDGAVNIAGVLDSTGTSAIVDAKIDNTGTIESTDGTFSVSVTTLTNAGTLTATGGSNFTLNADSLTNDSGAKIVAADASNFNVTDNGSTNLGIYEAIDHSTLTLNHEGTSINEVGGIIEAIDATIVLNDNLGDANYGTIDAINRGTIYLNVADTNATLQGGNHGLIEVLSGGAFIVTGDFLNWTGANVAAGGALSQVDFTNGTVVINDGTITAADYGEALFQDLSLAANAGRIEATSDGFIEFIDTTLNNNSGTISAADAGSSVQLSQAQIDGGAFSIGAGGELEIVTSSEISDAVISGSGQVIVDNGQALTFDTVTFANVTMTGSFINIGTAPSVEHAVTLSGATLTGGTDDLDSATSTVSVDSTIQLATLQNGALTVTSGQTLTLNGLVLDNVMLSGGTDDLAGVFSQVNADSTVKNATLQDGTLAVTSGQTLTLDGVTLANVTLSGGTDDLHGAFSAVNTNSEIESATLENGKLTVAPGQTLTLRGVTLDHVTLSGGTDDLDRNSHASASSSLVGADSTIQDATLQDGTLVVASGQTLTLDCVTLNNLILFDGTVDLDHATSLVSSDITIEYATLRNGTLTVASDQTLILESVTLDCVTLSGGTVDLDGITTQVKGDSTIENATLQDGTLLVASGQTLTLDGVTLDSLVLFGGNVDFDCATSLVSSDVAVDYATLQNGTLAVASDQTLTLDSVTLDWVTLSCGTVDLDGIASQVNGDSTIENTTLQDGTLLVASGETLTLDGVTLDNLVLFGGTVDLDCATSLVSSDVAVEYATLQNGTLAVASDQTLTLDGVTLDDITLSGGTIDFDRATSTVGAGSNIEDATLRDGTLTVPYGETLTLQGSVTIEPDAAIVATGILTLAAGSTINNAGVLFAYGGGELDVQNCQINNTGAGLNGIVVTGTGSELLVDAATLMLVGYGTVTLTGGGAIVGNGESNTPDTLVNVDNTIDGGGTIGDAGNGELALVNGVDGTILTEGILIFDTGHTIENAGLLIALGRGEFDIQDSRIDNTNTTLGILVAETGSELLVDTTTLKLVGEGTVTLASGGAIVGNGSPGMPDTLENVDNTILGAGTIGDAGNGELALINDVNGTIAAYGVLTFATGNTINNAGVLTALQGGELDVQDCQINNTGTNLDGIVVTGARSELLVDTATLKLVGDGTVTLASGGAILGNGTPWAADTLVNVDNTITGTGTIGDAGNGELAMLNDVRGTIAASGGTLTLDTGHTIANAGLLQATGGGTLDVIDNVKGAGSIEIGNGATVELGGTATNLVTFEASTGTLQIDSPGTSCHYSIFGGGALLPSGDEIYLPNISFDAAADCYNANTGVITVSNGTSGGTVTIDVAGGVGSGDTFVFASQGSGTLVYDPPSGTDILDPPEKSPGASVSANGDTFVFHPGMGADIASNFTAKTDTIDLEHFANIGSDRQLTSLIASNAHGDAVIELGHHDSITLPGVSANTLQAHLHSLVHLI